jgi:hypothetical protein
VGDALRPLILIPYYRPLEGDEWDSFDALAKHLGRYDWALIGPKRLGFDSRSLDWVETPSTYWNAGPDGRRGYNPLMCARGLYDALADYSHVLVYQLDAIVFSDRLAEFAALPLDYIGAPHRNAEGTQFVAGGGNGGFSLRRISAFRETLDGMVPWPGIESYYQHVGTGEDLFWSEQARRANPDFRPAELRDQLRFAWECDPGLAWLLNERELPMGAHGYARHSPEFWANLGGVRALAGLPARPVPGTAPPASPPPP